MRLCALAALIATACSPEPDVAKHDATTTDGATATDGASDTATDATPAPPDADSSGGVLTGAIIHDRALAKAPSWQELGTFALDSAGVTETMTVKVPVGARYVAIRVRTNQVAAGDPACLRLSNVKTAKGAVWVPATDQSRNDGTCSDCSQVVTNARGYGLFVFPNDGGELGDVGSLSFTVHTRHCMTDLLLPLGALGSKVTEIIVEAGTEPAWPAQKPTRLDLLLAFDAKGLLDAKAHQAFTVQLQAQMRAKLTPIGVDLRFIAWVAVDLQKYGFGDKVDVSADVVHKLDPVQAAVDAAAEKLLANRLAGASLREVRLPTLMLVPCIQERNMIQSASYVLAGKSLRIPGGARVGDYASMLLLATDCDESGVRPLNAQKLGLIAAHELGHHLGLHHSDGEHGLAAAATATDLMHSNVAISGQFDAAFSTKQAVVIRAHPDVYAD